MAIAVSIVFNFSGGMGTSEMSSVGVLHSNIPLEILQYKIALNEQKCPAFLCTHSIILFKESTHIFMLNVDQGRRCT